MNVLLRLSLFVILLHASSYFNIYRNFDHLPARQITRLGQFLQWREKIFNRATILADNPHPKTKENRRLTQSSFIVFVDMISFSVQLINSHTFCLRNFIENDTTCKNLF